MRVIYGRPHEMRSRLYRHSIHVSCSSTTPSHHPTPPALHLSTSQPLPFSHTHTTGTDPASYDHVELWLPHSSISRCGWSGLGSIGGKYSWQLEHSAIANRYGVRMHELGHNLGLHHSGWMNSEGVAVSEYGDPSAVLGSGPRLMAPGYILPNLVTMGWLPLSKVHSWVSNTLITIEDIRNDIHGSSNRRRTTHSSSSSVTPTAATRPRIWGARLAISDESRAIWLSYRTGSGIDATLPTEVKGAISVHYADHDGAMVSIQSYALGLVRLVTSPLRYDHSVPSRLHAATCTHMIKVCAAGATSARVALAAATTEERRLRRSTGCVQSILCRRLTCCASTSSTTPASYCVDSLLGYVDWYGC